MVLKLEVSSQMVPFHQFLYNIDQMQLPDKPICSLVV